MELIGKEVINIKNEIGVIKEIDSEGIITVSYKDGLRCYLPDTIEKGLLKFIDKETSTSIKVEKTNILIKEMSDSVQPYLDELDSLVGLESIKEIINDLICQINISNMRKAFGLKTPETTKHLVFIGNPGTGKTTVARIIAKIYSSLGVLSKGHLIEADRSTLVAEYQGQTATKTKEVIDKARGGILFIDEAYSLTRSRNDEYGLEAIDTLVKYMEDYRDDLVVIVAGYQKEMEEFIASNPGLSSRFKTVVNFKDYSSNELVDIFKNIVKDNDYKLDKGVLELVAGYFKNNRCSSNARSVRNIFEDITRLQSRRLNSLKNINKDILMSITKEDLICLG